MLISPDIYFPIEITAREYAGHILLGTELAARGRTVIIGHKGPVARIGEAAAQRGVVFYKNAKMPDWAAGRHELVGLDPEAGIVFKDYADFHVRRNVVARDSVNRAQFCFGPDDFDYLSERFPDIRHRIHASGSPRVELWAAAGEHFYSEDSARIQSYYGQFVLFSSVGGFEHEKTLGWRNAEPTSTWESADHARYFLAMAIAASRAEIRVVIRPHPAESWTAWRNAIAGIPGVTIDATYDLAAWTRVAQAVVHPGTSTAAFEAVCAQTPAISTQSYSKPVPTVAADLSYHAHDADELMKLLEKAKARRLATFPNSDAQLLLERKLLHPLEGATVRVADILDASVPFEGDSELRVQKIARRDRALKYLRRRPLQRTLGDQRPRPFKRDPLFLETVERDVASCLRILGRTDEVQVRELDENCFALSL